MTTGSSSSSVTSDDKLWALLAYVFTPLIPIVIVLMEDKKNRPYLKQHNMQALVYGVVLVLFWILAGFLTLALVGLCLYPILFLAWVVALYWGYQAYQGKSVTIPVITDFVKQQGWA